MATPPKMCTYSGHKCSVLALYSCRVLSHDLDVAVRQVVRVSRGAARLVFATSGAEGDDVRVAKHRHSAALGRRRVLSIKHDPTIATLKLIESTAKKCTGTLIGKQK